jgi:hypothetical protein
MVSVLFKHSILNIWLTVLNVRRAGQQRSCFPSKLEIRFLSLESEEAVVSFKNSQLR